ncbi:thioredoxin-related transmembrane protein 1 [Protopterus annectens]|uniref:thioredoxin-related transmembrane protein 1 n=1 Tax=Protopterus annectens TaxID=7888 RepID=UPI001CF9C293|nr:thioredoxin-related transmembrane protein 1 [Protopterus annectens]
MSVSKAEVTDLWLEMALSRRIALAVMLILTATLWHVAAKPNTVKVITDENWRGILEGEWMIEFYAPWCPACQSLQPEWNEFADWGEDLDVSIAKVDVTEQPGLSGRFVITSLPTIYHCKDGVFRRYQGSRTKTDFISFIDEKKWEEIEPVSSWFGPSSVLMSSMSALFQFSMWIRSVHSYFTEEVGLPVWGSYTIFALATLLSGLTLGLILVFVADCLCPSKRCKPKSFHYPDKLTPEAAKLMKELEADDELEMSDKDDDDEELPLDENTFQTSVRKRKTEAGDRNDDS